MAIPAWAVSQCDGDHGAAAGCAQLLLPSAAERLYLFGAHPQGMPESFYSSWPESRRSIPVQAHGTWQDSPKVLHCDMLLSGFGALGFDRFCGLRRGEFCRSNLADPDRLGELFEIFSTLVGIGNTEAGDCLVELIAVAQVSRDGIRVAGAGMSLGQQFAADLRVLHQSVAFQILVLNYCLVIAQLAHQVAVASYCSPPQEDVRLHLHGALSLGCTLSLIHGSVGLG